MLQNILLVGLGGFIGSMARYFILKHNTEWSIASIPVGTLIVNVLGCLIVGIILGVSAKHNFLSNEIRLFLVVGICGGFTTFSTFALENFLLFENGQLFSAFTYISLSVILCIAAVFLGFAATNWF